MSSKNYAAELKVEAVDYAERVIYHSPETPGYTCWVGMWSTPDGWVRCAFRQLIGPKDKPVASAPILEASDGGKSWAAVKPATASNPFPNDSYRCITALAPEGTLARGIWGSTDENDVEHNSGYVVRSTDGGRT